MWLVANWKMYLALPEAKLLARVITKDSELRKMTGVSMVVCPDFLALSDMPRRTFFSFGSQDVFFEKRGAYTGSISGEDLVSLGVRYAIIGHSEKKQYGCETDEAIQKKIKRCLECGLTPIVCVGENMKQRQSGKSQEVIENQLTMAFQKITISAFQKILIAYEPVWAISHGDGEQHDALDAKEADSMAHHIREFFEKKFSVQNGFIDVLYGGSVSESNIAAFLETQNLDGVLLGSAGTDFSALKRICLFIEEASKQRAATI